MNLRFYGLLMILPLLLLPACTTKWHNVKTGENREINMGGAPVTYPQCIQQGQQAFNNCLPMCMAGCFAEKDDTKRSNCMNSCRSSCNSERSSLEYRCNKAASYEDGWREGETKSMFE